MTQPRRPAGTPIGGQFAPTNRPEAKGIELVDDELVEVASTAPAVEAQQPRRRLTTDPVLARLDDAGRRLAAHLGYYYAGIDAVEEHHGLITNPSTLGFVTYDAGRHFFPVGTSATGHAVLPLGPQVFTPDELEAEIAKVTPPQKTPSEQPRVPSAGDARSKAEVASKGRPQPRYSHASDIREGQRSPWGTIDYVSRRAVGITDVGTSGHGGVKLSSERNRAVHPAWRRPGGWYEEDCEWAIVAVTFPECYPPEQVKVAWSELRHWFPDEYEAVTGTKIAPGESYIRDEQAFFAEHANDWITTAAIAVDEPKLVELTIQNDTADGPPHRVRAEQQMVKVWVRVGGRTASASAETRAFLVPADEYASRGRFGFVVDPDKYEEVVP